MDSCVGCKFLYAHDMGYSNYTVEDTEIYCAKGMNKNLPASRPYDWNTDDDNWAATMHSRCAAWAPGNMVCLDVDGDDTAASQTDDAEVIALIDRRSP